MLGWQIDSPGEITGKTHCQLIRDGAAALLADAIGVMAACLFIVGATGCAARYHRKIKIATGE